MTELLRVRTATRVFGPDAGLFDVDLEVEAGQIHALIGLNGAGKTTLMRAILGMLRLQRGEVCIDSVPLPRSSGAVWSRVGHLVEHPFAYPDLDTRNNLALAARLNGLDPASIPAVVDGSIEEMGLGSYRTVLARRLSQGNRQRLGLAAALQHDPGLIVLDEPTSALDPAGVILLRESLLRRAREGASVLVSSHHLDEVARIAHRISVLNHGRIIGNLDPATPDLERAFFRLVYSDDERRQP